ncbi:MAG: hypothetical protein MUE41_06280 [Gemmatimonadaceae bacterium]|jgi:glutamyl-tRNA reductase|nr:hypothetical protein [Gemmatimonadaceae bacterium]
MSLFRLPLAVATVRARDLPPGRRTVLAAARAASAPEAPATIVLVTCERVTFVSWGDAGPRRRLAGWLSALGHADAARSIRVVRADAALRHLLRVIAGEASSLRGEREIERQWLAAWQRARATGRSTSELDWFAQRLLGGARRIRRRAGDAPPDLGTHVLRTLRQQLVLPWGDATVAVVGTGSAAATVAHALRRRPPRRVVILGRDVAAAGRLARIADGAAVPLHQLGSVLQRADAAVFAVGVPTPLLNADGVAALVRDGRPRSWFDLGVVPTVACPQSVESLTYLGWHESAPSLDRAQRAARVQRALRSVLADLADDWTRRAWGDVIAAFAHAAGEACDVAMPEGLMHDGAPHDAPAPAGATHRCLGARRLLDVALGHVGGRPRRDARAPLPVPIAAVP